MRPRPKHASGCASFCDTRRTASAQVRPQELRRHLGGSRFLQVDPVEGGSANDYDYVEGDPVNNFDLAGTWCVTGKNKNGTCRSISRGSGRVARKVYRHANVSAGGCWYICANLSFAHGHVYLSGGGAGMGLRGLGIGWTTAVPEQQRRWGLQSCAAYVVGGCMGIGERTTTRRRWTGTGWESYHPVFYSFGVQVGIGASTGPTYTRRLF
jgi:hypothetical protein